MNVFLEPVSGKGLKIPMDKAIIFIGRHPDCDVVITRSRMISRKHCALVQIDKSFVIRDLGSTNGVKVNGERVQKEARFHPRRYSDDRRSLITSSGRSRRRSRPGGRTAIIRRTPAGAVRFRCGWNGCRSSTARKCPSPFPKTRKCSRKSSRTRRIRCRRMRRRTNSSPMIPNTPPNWPEGVRSRLPRRRSDSDPHVPLSD